MRGAVDFIGAGPGAADLITLRGANRIAEADLVLYAQSVTDVAWLRLNTKEGAELVDYSRLPAEDVTELYRKIASRRQRAVRLYAGDTAQSPELREHRELCEKVGLDVEVVPGVAPLSAAAAVTGNALVETGIAETFVFTEADLARVSKLVSRCATVAVQLPAARAADLSDALIEAGVDPATPVAVAYKVSCPDQVLARTTVGELAAEVKRHSLWRATLFLVGDAMREAKPRAGAAKVTDSDVPVPRWSSRGWKSTGAKSTWSARNSAVKTCVEPDEPLDAPEAAPAPEPVKVNGTNGTNGTAVIGALKEPKVNGVKPVNGSVNGTVNGAATGANAAATNGAKPAESAAKPRQTQTKASAKAPAKKTAPNPRAAGRRATKKA